VWRGREGAQREASPVAAINVGASVNATMKLGFNTVPCCQVSTTFDFSDEIVTRSGAATATALDIDAQPAMSALLFQPNV
jgi:hypothetical protein